MLVARTQFGEQIRVAEGTGAPTIASLAFWSKFFVGRLASSLLSTLNEFKKALDNSDSARVPQFVGLRTDQPDPDNRGLPVRR